MLSTKALTGASLAGFAFSQTASVSSYSVATGTLSESKVSLVNSNFGINYSELINGDQSYTLVNDVF